ncbi:S8 family peptidase [Amycolatopsis samaneae]|uniref:S8 family peptidase n=1 Tax=Amycolatopsis samaneae TaxID=664691 RepID=A0ABW5G8S9_9PSEU
MRIEPVRRRPSRTRRWGTATLVLGIAAGAVTATPPGPATALARPAPGTGISRTVTLVTGDRVVLPQGGAPTLLPAPGREHLGFATREDGTHLHVVPQDAGPLIAAGKVDERLFDVTTLIESGYDDAGRPDVPLILVPADAARPFSAAGARVTAALPVIHGSAVSAPKNTAPEFWRALDKAAYTRIWLDGVRKPALDRSAAQIGAPAAWKAGFTGEGVTIAVLDSGVDRTHPDFAGRVVAEQNFSASPDTVDRFGHGTHVASIAAGSGAKSGGKYRGIAFGAKIMSGKVFGDNGLATDTSILRGVQWAAEQGVKVVNMSITNDVIPGFDPVVDAVNTLSAARGTLFVIASGNGGPDEETLTSPGIAEAALTVGAVERDDTLAPFSSRGPRRPDGAVKPDLTAPGVGIVGAKSAESREDPPVEDGYTAGTGTSMATPHVAGAAAILAQKHPDWTGQRLKAALTASAKPQAGQTVFQQGSGRVDVAKALDQTVSTTPSNVNLGVQPWPHQSGPLHRTYAYRNGGTAEVTLDLAVSGTGPDGRPAPGVFSVEPARVTVPAGAERTVTLSGDATSAPTDGEYGGTVVATSAQTTVTTPVSLDREPESFDVTFNHIGHDGAPARPTNLLVTSLDSQKHYNASSTTIRLPKGRYLVDSSIVEPDREMAWLVLPTLDVAGNLTVDLDTRLAKPVKITAPDPTARMWASTIGYHRVARHSFQRRWTFLDNDLSWFSMAQIGPDPPPADLLSQVSTQWETPSGDFYGLAWYREGSFPTGFTRVVTKVELATVHVELAAPTAGRQGIRTVTPAPRFREGIEGPVPVRRFPLPTTITEYYTTGDIAWRSTLEDGETRLVSPARALEAGRTYRQTFNRAVFGPALPPTPDPARWISRTGNTVSVRAPLFGDADGNAGYSTVDSANTVLYRDGREIGRTPLAGEGEFTVPAEPGTYRLTTEASRTSTAGLSSRVSAAWTFGSRHTEGPARLPIGVIRFAPGLDADNAAPAGRPYLLPLAYWPQGSDTGEAPAQLTVEVSYDGGVVWTAAPVLANGLALLHHPAGASTVSLRARATDRYGTTAEQTVVNAYKLK